MMKGSTIFTLLLIFGLTFSAVIAEHHEKAEEHQMEWGAPGQMKDVAFLEGEWDVDIAWQDMENPEKWNKSKNSCTYKYVLDGCAMECRYKGEMMDMPFDGYMLMSYDRDNKQWQSIWIDSMGGKMSFYTGGFVDDKITLSGEENWGGQKYHSRWTTFNQTDKSFEWTMDNSFDSGKTWMTVGKATYTKK